MSDAAATPKSTKIEREALEAEAARWLSRLSTTWTQVSIVKDVSGFSLAILATKGLVEKEAPRGQDRAFRLTRAGESAASQLNLGHRLTLASKNGELSINITPP